jgi:hypothetical protein
LRKLIRFWRARSQLGVNASPERDADDLAGDGEAGEEM